MHVKKFEGKTLKEALGKIKQELGPDAIVLSTKHLKNPLGIFGKGGVEVTAAVSEKGLNLQKKVDQVLPQEERDKFSNLPGKKQREILERFDAPQSASSNPANNQAYAGRPANIGAQVKRFSEGLDAKTEYGVDGSVSQTSSGLSQISSQILKSAAADQENQNNSKEIKKIYEELKTVKNLQGLYLQQRNKNLDSFVQYLKIKGFHSDFISNYVDHLLKNFEEISPENLAKIKVDLYQFIQTKIKIAPPIQDYVNQNKADLHIFIGENGSGKTTTIAKIAAVLKMRFNLKIGILSNDCSKIGGVEQMSTIAKILDIPFAVAGTPQDLIKCCHEWNKFDLILMDTAGLYQNSNDYLPLLKEYQKFYPQTKFHLISSITTDLNELLNQQKMASGLNLVDITFTKLDAVANFGNIFNFAYFSNLPVAYFSNGVEIPHKIERASPEKILKFLFSKN